MADLFNTISVISFVAAGAFLVLAIVLWFVFKIPQVVGDLSGKNARRSIEQMRRDNATKAKSSPKAKKPVTPPVNRELETGLLTEDKTSLLAETKETELLFDSMETAPLIEPVDRPVRPAAKIALQLVDEVMLVHTNEEIRF